MDTIRVAERAQRALRLAFSEAKRQGSAVVTVEHVFASVLDDGHGEVGRGVVTGVLERLGVQRDQLITELESVSAAVSDLPETKPVRSPDVIDVLRIASDEARSMEHDWVGAEHLLLAIVQGSSRASAICRKHRLDATNVRQAIQDLLGPAA